MAWIVTAIAVANTVQPTATDALAGAPRRTAVIIAAMIRPWRSR